MRKVFAAAALAGSMALTGLALAPAAQAASAPATTQAASATAGTWGKYYSSNRKAYTYGQTWKSGGKVHTKWYGKESTSKHGYVWFRYEYKSGKIGKHFYRWNGSHKHIWSKRDIKKLYTYTCWGGPTKHCGAVHRIY
ncbi:hypothetical protein [Nonomuraea sp. C10]|uniref:hypothetical protein n=1 Tax=Nonomuraea sp. C10 TaxID=2600577 RepID=UPI0011CD636A|nr:hypothetical protein [Nonomuraea sp. C10]TXK35822.1 hypothetical protein FR742_42375 [Nonomuraea sp. C10]